MLTEKPKLHIFIPVYKNHVYLKHMLETVVCNTKEVEYTLINNGSDDDTNKFCKILQRRKGFTVHHYKEALGVSRVWNLCLDIAIERGIEQIIITNADLLFHKTCLDRLTDFMDHNPNEVLACAMDIKKVIEVVERFPFLREESINQFTYSAAGMQSFRDILDSINMSVDEPFPVEQIVDYSCFIVRPKKLVEEIGYFDENFLPAYWEDTDMHWRLADRGYTTKSILNAPMMHIHSRSLKEGGFKNDSYLPNGFYFSKKHNAQFKPEQLIKDSQGKVFSLKTFNAPDAYRALENDPVRKVYDCFTFNGNLDLLERKLETLANHVDMFVIAEAILDMDGNPKPLYLKENKDRFSKFTSKMRRIIVQDFKNASTAEERQKLMVRALANGLKDAKIQDNIILSTEDSLWDIRKIREFQRMRGVKVLEQKELIDFANVEGPEIFTDARLLSHKVFLDDFNGDLSHVAESSGFKVANSGWRLKVPKLKNTDLQKKLEEGVYKLIPLNRRHLPSLWGQSGWVFKPITHKGETFINSTLEK